MKVKQLFCKHEWRLTKDLYLGALIECNKCRCKKAVSINKALEMFDNDLPSEDI